MSKTKSLVVLTVLTLLLCGALLAPAHADGQRFALLVGVGDYDHINDLGGPRNDVLEFEKVALKQWQVPAKNIIKLLDGQASRDNILAALDELDTRTRAGDWAFVYFSGHGTSTQALTRNGRSFDALPDDTGAFLSADFRSKSADGAKLDATSLVKQMLVGRWDLKPRLMKLDQKGVESFVVIDSCFSENAFRAIAPDRGGPKLVSRFVSVADAPPGKGICEHCQNSEAVRGYTYKNSVIFYASANDQTAADITELGISSGAYSTLSNKPHGLYSDSVLRGLAQLDESESSFEDLFQVSKDYMHDNCGGKCKQDPGSVPVPEETTLELLSRRVISSTTAPAAPLACTAQTRSVSIPAGFDRLRESVALNVDFQLVEDNADISLRKHQGEWGFYSQGGSKLVGLNEVKDYFGEWLATRSWLQLLDCEIGQRNNDFALTLRNGDGLHGDLARTSVPLYFSVNTGASSRLLLLDINPQGEVFVLYPFIDNELNPAQAKRDTFIPSDDPAQAIRVVPPFGQESLWLLAFSDEQDAALLQKFQRAAEAPLDPRGALMAELRRRLKQPGGVAQRRMNIFTLDN